jgi:hypothetical protein
MENSVKKKRKRLGPVDLCYKKACALATLELKTEKKDGKTKCKCDNGKIKIECSTYGSNKPATVTKITCMDCNGTGELSSKNYFQVLVGKKVWCCCPMGIRFLGMIHIYVERVAWLFNLGSSIIMLVCFIK